MINVSIDTGLVISFIMLGWLLNGIISIGYGLLGVEKEKTFGVGTVIAGVIYLIIVVVVLVW